MSAWAVSKRKRCLDLTLSLVLTIVTLPLVLVLALGSAIAYRAWPFFTQRRLGRHGREFIFVKLRSLPTTTPADADKYRLGHIENSRWGRTLRATHLDELPQLWHVLAGRMSLVGPRPEMPNLAATFDPAFVQERLAVRPGCTGPWQLSTASAGLIGEAPEFDRAYLAYASFRTDVALLVKTVAVVCHVGQPLRAPADVLGPQRGSARLTPGELDRSSVAGRATG